MVFVIAKRKSCGVEHMLWVAKCGWVAGVLVGVAIKGQWLYWDQDVPAMIGRAQSSSGTIRLLLEMLCLGNSNQHKISNSRWEIFLRRTGVAELGG